MLENNLRRGHGMFIVFQLTIIILYTVHVLSNKHKGHSWQQISKLRKRSDERTGEMMNTYNKGLVQRVDLTRAV